MISFTIIFFSYLLVGCSYRRCIHLTFLFPFSITCGPIRKISCKVKREKFWESVLSHSSNQMQQCIKTKSYGTSKLSDRREHLKRRFPLLWQYEVTFHIPSFFIWDQTHEYKASILIKIFYQKLLTKQVEEYMKISKRGETRHFPFEMGTLE